MAKSPALCEENEDENTMGVMSGGVMLTCSPNWLSSVFLTYGSPVRSAALAGEEGTRYKGQTL